MYLLHLTAANGCIHSVTKTHIRQLMRSIREDMYVVFAVFMKEKRIMAQAGTSSGSSGNAHAAIRPAATAAD